MRRGREDCVMPCKEGRERRNSKRKTDSREEKPFDFNIKKTDKVSKTKQTENCM
jgi:hypothetical protein